MAVSALLTILWKQHSRLSSSLYMSTLNYKRQKWEKGSVQVESEASAVPGCTAQLRLCLCSRDQLLP